MSKRFPKMSHHALYLLLNREFGQRAEFFGAEIGVYKGVSTRVLLERFPHCRLLLVDPWKTWDEDTSYGKSSGMQPKTQVDWNTVYTQALENIGPATHRCRVMRMTSELAAAQVPDKSLDFVFIDADHTYEATKRDIELWLPKVKTIIIGHDYNGKGDRAGCWGVKRAVDEAFGDQVEIRKGLIWAHRLPVSESLLTPTPATSLSTLFF
jgi:hypothetical protein